MTPRPALLLPLLLTLAACGTSPPTRFFALEPVPPSRPPVAAARGPVSVDDVEIPGVLDRDEIVRRDGPYRLEISGDERWGAPLDEMIRSVLARDLATRLPHGTVIPPGGTQAAGARRAVLLDVARFDADAKGEVVLDASWAVTGGGRPRWRHAHIGVAGAGPGPAAQAAAMSEALGRLADEIASALAEGRSVNRRGAPRSPRRAAPGSG